MTTFAQDYAPLPGSVGAAVQHARTVVGKYLPGRADDAEHIVRALISDALTRTSSAGTIGLITTMGADHVRFEVHDPNTPVPGAAVDREGYRLALALADRYGSWGSRDRHVAWVELYVRRVAPV